MVRRFKAYLLLTLALITTLLRRTFSRSKQGIAAFRANYDADRLPPLTAEERAALNGFNRCIGCGLCDHGESARIAASGGQYPGLMTLVLAGSRSMPDFSAAAAGFAHVPDAVMAEKEAICPTRVPFRAIASFVRNKALETERSLAPSSVRRQGAREDAPRLD